MARRANLPQTAAFNGGTARNAYINVARFRLFTAPLLDLPLTNRYARRDPHLAEREFDANYLLRAEPWPMAACTSAVDYRAHPTPAFGSFAAANSQKRRWDQSIVTPPQGNRIEIALTWFSRSGGVYPRRVWGHRPGRAG
jgi:hypothetical protein